MTIASTTPQALELAIIAAIASIVPTHPVEQDGGWKPADDNMLAGASSLVPRVFEIRTAPGGTVRGGITGNGDTEKSLNLDVVVDYRAFRDQDLSSIVENDQWDIHDHLSDRLDNGITGLTGIEDPLGPRPDEKAESRIVHQFTIFYLRTRS
jgi:hypothetical protein